jgi:hypothetical protein
MGNNQTHSTSPIASASTLPFGVTIRQAPFRLGTGVQAFSIGAHGRRWWLLLGGRTNGLHGFSAPPADNFPSASQNTNVMVVDWKRGTTRTRSLNDAASGLTPLQVCQLASTSQQAFQRGRWLYVAGGYGVDPDGNYVTFDSLTRINVRGAIRWVLGRRRPHRLVDTLRQTRDAQLQLMGGRMYQACRGDPLLLAMGQTFTGPVYPSGNGVYSQQVRQVRLGQRPLRVARSVSTAAEPYERRRDFNLVPYLDRGGRRKRAVVLSGVFTENGGVWTVPVEVTGGGLPSMADPTSPAAFKQGMNNYACAAAALYSRRRQTNYAVLMGGITYRYWDGSAFVGDAELPFTNQTTVVRRSDNGLYDQLYVADGAFPVIASTTTNPGNPLLFGTASRFVLDPSVATCGPRRQAQRDVVDLDTLLRRGGGVSRRIGWIVGGIASTLPNTDGPSDSWASDYVFEVWIGGRS